MHIVSSNPVYPTKRIVETFVFETLQGSIPVIAPGMDDAFDILGSILGNLTMASFLSVTTKDGTYD